MQITFYGHACFGITSKEHRLIIDPFLNGNPQATVKPEEIAVDWILVTHAHADHLGDTIAIAKANKATVITGFELATWLEWQGVTTHSMGPGGSYRFPFGRVTLTPALHGSGLLLPEEKRFLEAGPPAGFLIDIGGKSLYHAGDTALFSDMRLIGRHQPLDVAILPIGDNYTMGPEDAVMAADFLDARLVIPCHYNTMPEIRQDSASFCQALAQQGRRGLALQVNDSYVVE